MAFSRRVLILAIVCFLVFFGTTVFAHLLQWDTASFKRLEDMLVIIIGSSGWVLTARIILRNGLSFSSVLGVAVFSIIITMHVLRALHGALIC